MKLKEKLAEEAYTNFLRHPNSRAFFIDVYLAGFEKAREIAREMAKEVRTREMTARDSYIREGVITASQIIEQGIKNLGDEEV